MAIFDECPQKLVGPYHLGPKDCSLDTAEASPTHGAGLNLRTLVTAAWWWPYAGTSCEGRSRAFVVAGMGGDCITLVISNALFG